MSSFRAPSFCCKNGSIADSPFLTVTGEEKLYSKRSPASRPSAVDEILENCSESVSPAPGRYIPPNLAADCGAAIAIALDGTPPITPPMVPSNTVGAAALLSASSAFGRVTYFGAYNCATNEIGLPDTTDNRTLFQSSPDVLSTIAHPSSVGWPSCGNNNR